jgi:hypothetical protein
MNDLENVLRNPPYWPNLSFLGVLEIK